jgi:succinate dehydrogenase/fumarate reductase cytochrome b subunit
MSTTLPDESPESTGPDGSSEPDGSSGSDGSSELDGSSGSGPSDQLDGSSPARRGPNVLAAVAGALCLVYVVWYILDLLALSADPAAFNAVHSASNNIGMRLLFAVLFLGITYHGLDGLRRTLVDLRPRSGRRDQGLRAGVAFLTMAAWIPVTVILVWPSVRNWWT